ncbi:ATP-grasp domain-containing protein [Chryseobacterium sp. PBS4-4]|uniref:ATP-grasp domain-containing protein n=1 Tax=Chryseobacterium edaphi TaxID=2976532 RepID=A0ABT2W9F1_9FLAO|nr:ATP-grasp domain-containing protein [Chryseobacterium edaphi]MCU7618843.1 ATP-grasp domain-containing protein [Chryseobacterium edaphi]
MKNIVALSPVFTEDSINLKHASIGSDYNLNRFNLKWNVPKEFRNDVIAVYGEDIYAEIVSSQCDLTLLKTEDNWLSNISEKFTKRNIQYGQLEQFINHQNIFIKCSDFKSFKAGVYENVSDIKGFDSLDKQSMVFISDVVEWELEVRCFVLNGKVETYSTYWRDNQFDTNGLSDSEEVELFSFFESFVKDNLDSLPPSIVLDFGIIKDNGWALIEANPAWCSGLYASNAKKALDVIIKSCIKN